MGRKPVDRENAIFPSATGLRKVEARMAEDRDGTIETKGAGLCAGRFVGGKGANPMDEMPS